MKTKLHSSWIYSLRSHANDVMNDGDEGLADVLHDVASAIEANLKIEPVGIILGKAPLLGPPNRVQLVRELPTGTSLFTSPPTPEAMEQARDPDGWLIHWGGGIPDLHFTNYCDDPKADAIRVRGERGGKVYAYWNNPPVHRVHIDDMPTDAILAEGDEMSEWLEGPPTEPGLYWWQLQGSARVHYCVVYKAPIDFVSGIKEGELVFDGNDKPVRVARPYRRWKLGGPIPKADHTWEHPDYTEQKRKQAAEEGEI